jgi:ribonuclease P protein subunit RPR2
MIRREKKLEKQIAGERIRILLQRAQKIKMDDCELARRYVELAKNIAVRYRVKIPKELKMTFCKKCLHLYRSGRVRVRIRKARIITTCLNCGFERRIPIKKYKII